MSFEAYPMRSTAEYPTIESEGHIDELELKRQLYNFALILTS